jgi:peptide/nickel transport system permease protein
MNISRKMAGLPFSLVAGAMICALVLLLSFGGPLLPLPAYDQMDVMARLNPPSFAHPLGTDEFGRDVLSRTVYGGKLSLLLGLGATAVSLAIGVPAGLAAGYFRGRVDEIIMRWIDIMMAIPPVLLGMLILALATPSLTKLVLAVGLVYVPVIVRLTRSVTLSIGREEFVDAARVRDEKVTYILFSEILPNALPAISVEASLRVSFAMMLGAALSFLGLGIHPPSSDWGLMIAEARPLLNTAPWIALSPGLALCLTVIGINLLGDGMRQLFDRRMS